MPCPICDEKPINCQCTEAELRMYYEIEELEEQLPRWIPVGERLPEAGVTVLVREYGDTLLAELNFSTKTGTAYFSAPGRSNFEVTHWMPLPEPPEVK